MHTFKLTFAYIENNSIYPCGLKTTKIQKNHIINLEENLVKVDADVKDDN